MTPKEKAKELIDKYKEFTEDGFAESYYNAKQCALIAVDEMLNELNEWTDKFGWINRIKYLQEVKQEIEKL